MMGTVQIFGGQSKSGEPDLTTPIMGIGRVPISWLPRNSTSVACTMFISRLMPACIVILQAAGGVALTILRLASYFRSVLSAELTSIGNAGAA